MRIFKKIITVLAIIVLLIAAIGFIFFSSHIHVDRSVVINQRPDSVFSYISDMKNWNTWSPWYKKDPNAKYEFANGATTGVGAILSWKSENKNVGNGTMKITELKPDSIVRMDLIFMDSGVANSYYTVYPEGNGSKVTWGFDVDAGANPLMRIVGHFMDGMLGKEFEEGLKELKINLETQR